MAARRTAREKTAVEPSKRDEPRAFDIFAYVLEQGKTIPAEELARMPRDGAKNFDHYLDGSPKWL